MLFRSKLHRTKTSSLDNVTPLYSLNDTGLTFNVTELIIPKQGLAIDQIIHCLDWNYSTSNCSSWETNDTTDFGMQENSTHFWFNVTSFKTFGGGSGNTLPNLTNIKIYDVTGLSQTHWGGTLVKDSLNTTFNLFTGRVYRAEFYITNNGISWTIDSADRIFHYLLNSSWTINNTNDVWYTTDSGATNRTGGTWSNRNVSWNASLGGSLKNGQTGVFSYVMNLSSNVDEQLPVYFLVNDT